MCPLLAILALLAALPTFAVCTSHACSDDVDGVLGNEGLVWDPAERAEWYEVAAIQHTDLADDYAICAKVINSTSYLISGTPCDYENTGEGFVVRACNDAGCSSWSNSVEILPFACLKSDDWDPCLYHDSEGNCEGGNRTNCERKCYEWEEGVSWRRLEQKYEECP